MRTRASFPTPSTWPFSRWICRSSNRIARMRAPDGVLIRRSKRARHLSLRLDHAARCIRLTAPTAARPAEIAAFLDHHRGWVAAQRAALPPAVRLLPGNLLPLRGRPHRIRHDARWSRQPQAIDGEIRLGGPPERVAARLARWLRDEARADLAPVAAGFAERLDVTFGRISIRDGRSRWGSCSRRGTLSFSWRLVLAPPGVLRYVAAHEVVHLREMNHGPRFWALLDSLIGDSRAQRRWLRENGAALFAIRLPPYEGGEESI
ncbi:MAG: M48 family peptidase [Alphaproteobacteria bacterium]|nr:MAG: M48 family peptidase [Alphaproteobacteria bacterium]